MFSHAPIVLFVYARPDHTRKVLRALSKCPEARESTLYIYSDGPAECADEETLRNIAKVRVLLRESQWCGKVHIIESESNKGLAKSIVDGVSEVVRKHGKVVVLEDDIVLASCALTYFNTALDLYEKSDRVFQISGFMVASPCKAKPTGFLRMTTSWGWATWSRAWRVYQHDAESLLRKVEQKGREKFDLDGVSFHHEELSRNVSGDLRTWAVKWYASVFLKEGLCLYPKTSVVRNIGFDGSGENCGADKSGYFGRLPLAKKIHLSEQKLVEDQVYLKAMQDSFRHRLQVWRETRLRDRLKRKLQRLVNYKE